METVILEGAVNLKTENRRKELCSYSYGELINLFCTLEPASIDVLQGEVDGCTLASKGRWGGVINWLSTHAPFPGVWLGKGFTSNRDNTGRGYNRFSFFGIEHRSMRFATGPGLSLVDNKPVMLMDYKPYLNPPGLLSALDEIRQLDENNYLLCGHWKWPFFGKSQFFFYHIYGPLGKFND